MSLLEATKKAIEASLDIGVEALMFHAEAIGYKAEEPEECVRWELAKALYKEFKEELDL